VKDNWSDSPAITISAALCSPLIRETPSVDSFKITAALLPFFAACTHRDMTSEAKELLWLID
jgi:hypothetical protein